jgi:hypothetical protein
MSITVGDRIDWGSTAFPRMGTVTEVVGAIVAIAWDDGRATRVPVSVLERMLRRAAAIT